MTADDHVNSGATRDFLVFTHRKVSQSNDHFHSLPMQLRHDLLRCFAWIAKLDVVTGPRSSFCFRQDKTEEPDFDAAKLAHYKSFRIAERLVGTRVDNIRRDPRNFDSFIRS